MDVFFTETEQGNVATYYHPANSSRAKDRAVIICYPVGQEYIRFHKGIVNLAIELSLAGYEVFRFDYLGTGDSGGDLETIQDIEVWQTNLRMLINEAKTGTYVTKITLIAIRLGAMISNKSWRDDMVDSIVFWNPVFNGERFIQELIEDNNEYYRGSFAVMGEALHFESLGFSFAMNLVSSIKEYSLDDASSGLKVLWLDDSDRNFETLNKKAIEKSAMKFVDSVVTNTRFWKKKDSEEGKALVPFQEIQLIVKWMESL